MSTTENKSYDETPQDLFQHPEKLSKKIQNIIEKYTDADLFTCDDVKALLKDLEDNGYTFDYGLDCQPFNLRPNGRVTAFVKKKN